MLSFHIVKADTPLWGCWPNQASLERRDETWEEKRAAGWPANCPTNQSSQSWGTHPVQEDPGGWEAARFSTHGDIARESCSVGTVLPRVSGWSTAGPAGTTSAGQAQHRPAFCLFFWATAEIKFTVCLRLFIHIEWWRDQTYWLWSQLVS